MKIDPNAPASTLTVRAELAARAMQGMLSNPSWEPAVIADEKRVARSALLYADALIAALNESEGE